MGLFDTVVFERAEDAPLCAAGHSVMEYQTKDLGCSLLGYSIDGCGRLRTQDGDLLSPIPEHSFVRIYTSCDQCPQTVVTTGTRGWFNKIYPWVEYDLEFRSGMMVRKWVFELEEIQDVLVKFEGRVVSVSNSDVVCLENT